MKSSYANETSNSNKSKETFDTTNWSPIQKYTIFQNYIAIKSILDSLCDTCIVRTGIEHPINLAIRMHDTIALNILLPSRKIYISDSLNCLSLATLYPYTEVFDKLVEYNFRLDERRLNLINQCWAKDPSIMIKHLLNKYNYNVDGQSKFTPLMMTTKYGKFNLFKIFIKHGANPNIEDENGKTALDYAREYKIYSLVGFGGIAKRKYIKMRMIRLLKKQKKH